MTATHDHEVTTNNRRMDDPLAWYCTTCDKAIGLIDDKLCHLYPDPPYTPSLDVIRGRYCDGTTYQTGQATDGEEFDRAIAQLREAELPLLENFEDLQELPVGSIVTDLRARPFEKFNSGGWYTTGDDWQYGNEDIELPARLLLRGKQ